MTEDKSKEELPDVEKAIVKRKKGISPIWILPLVAALIGAWLIYKGIVEAPIKVVINFSTAEGITAGKTKVLYKGLKAGVVKSVQISPDLKSVDVVVDFDQGAENLLRSNSEFWLVKPRVSLEGITGLGTLMAGDHIAIRPGDGDGKPAKKFKALTEPPPIPADLPGLHLKLVSKELTSVERGSPVFYKRIAVGDVQSFKLMDDREHVEINIYIHPQYSHLVSEHTRFYNASGIEIEGSLSSFKIRTQSITSILMGGIAFITPETGPKGRQAKNGDRFELFEDFQAAKTGIPITIRFATADGLEEGQTKVKLEGLIAGYVKKIDILPDLSGVNARVIMDPRADRFLLSDTRFWLVEPRISLAGVTGLETLVKGNFIGMQIGGKGKPQNKFVALEQAPALSVKAPGLHIQVIADELGSIDTGTPVYYKKIPVGHVLSYELNQKTDGIVISVFIKKKFQHLVKMNSRFWNASGISVSAGLSGIKIRTESLESILSAGIAFYTPEDDSKARAAKTGDAFELYADYERAHETGVPIKITFDGAEGLRAGTRIKYRGIQVGKVDSVAFGHSLNKVVVSAHLNQHASTLAREGSRFWIVKAKFGLAGVSQLGTLITGDYIAVRPAKTKGDLPSVPNEGETLHPNTRDPRVPMIRKRLSVTGDLKSENLTSDLYDEELVEAVKGFQARHGMAADGLIGHHTIAAMDASVDEKGKYKHEFIGLAEPPFEKPSRTGLAIALVADQLGSVKEGDKVYYREVEVGRVSGYELTGTADKVIIHVDIEHHYAHLVRKNSVFWNASGINIHAGLLSGAEIDFESLQSILAGGIAFYTPEHEPKGQPAGHGEKFKLYAHFESAHQIEKPGQPGLKIILLADQLGSITKGNKVYYREIVVGNVSGYELAETADHVLITVDIQHRFAPLVRENSVFWNASGIDVHFGLFSGAEIHTESLKSILGGGIAFATPDNKDMGKPAKPNARFPLLPKVKDQWLKWKPKIRLEPVS
jgi:paraquat-inducible protein B